MLERLSSLGPPAPALDEHSRPEPRERRWGLEYEQSQARLFWTALEGKTVAFVYTKGTRAGMMRRVRVERYDPDRGHIKTLDPGAPSGSSRTYNVRFLLNRQTEGGQRPGFGTALINRAGVLCRGCRRRIVARARMELGPEPPQAAGHGTASERGRGPASPIAGGSAAPGEAGSHSAGLLRRVHCGIPSVATGLGSL